MARKAQRGSTGSMDCRLPNPPPMYALHTRTLPTGRFSTRDMMSRNTWGNWVVDQEGQSVPRYRIPPRGPRASPCSNGPFPWSCRWRQRYDRTLKNPLPRFRKPCETRPRYFRAGPNGSAGRQNAWANTGSNTAGKGSRSTVIREQAFLGNLLALCGHGGNLITDITDLISC